MRGAWQDYFKHWRAMTQQNLDERLLELAPPLQALVPPAHLCGKAVYSAFGNPKLAPWLKSQGAGTLIVSGGETDVCVLATVMPAIDLGYRIVLATDALCSASDRTHDALMLLYRERFSRQLTMATTVQILEAWNWAPSNAFAETRRKTWPNTHAAPARTSNAPWTAARRAS